MTVVNDLQKLFRDGPLKEMNPYSREVFRKMGQCHTAGLGPHLYRCDNALCAGTELRYHCRGNRHCPNCGSMKREAWVEERTDELLPASYYHLVFTLPHGLGPMILGNRKAMFKMHFGAASETLVKKEGVDLPEADREKTMERLCQGPVRRAGTGGGIPGKVHP